MKNNLIALLVIVCFLSFSCAQDPHTKITRFDEEKLLDRLEELSSDKYEGRRTDTKGSASARAYIINEFKSLSIEGYNGDFEQEFSFSRNETQFNGTNILAEIKGSKFPDKYIVISAHYDHLGIVNGKIYNGADDDASGVAALISFAEFLSKNQPKYSVIIAAFDAEELGLKGAKYFVDTIDTEEVVLNINMDMISRSSKNELYVVGSRSNKELAHLIEAFENTTSTKLIVGHDGTDGKQNWTYSSDHAPFYQKGIPFLYFGNEDHKDYHKPTDDFKDITPEFYKNAVNIILSIFLTIDEAGL